MRREAGIRVVENAGEVGAAHAMKCGELLLRVFLKRIGHAIGGCRFILFRWHMVLLLPMLCLSFSGCITFGNGAQPEFQKAGVQYGVTKGLFRGRWWNHYERGRSYADGEYWAEAESDFRTALRTREMDQLWARTYGLHFLPEYFPHRELGVVLYRQGNLDEAIAELEASIAAQYSARAAFYLEEARRDQVTKGGLDAEAPRIELDGAGIPPAAGYELRLAGTLRDDTYVTRLWVNDIEQDLKLSAQELPFDVSVPVGAGSNAIRLVAEDIVGKRTEITVDALADVDGPVVGIDGPVALPGTIRGICMDASGVASVSIAGKAATLEPSTDGATAFTVALAPGDVASPPLSFEARDALGNVTTGAVEVDAMAVSLGNSGLPDALTMPAAMAAHGLDAYIAGSTAIFFRATPDEATGLKAELVGMADGQRFTMEEIVVQVLVEGDAPIAGLTLNDVEVDVLPGAKRQRFSRLVQLAEGENTLRLVARDEQGREATSEVRVQRVKSAIEQEAARLHLLFAGSIFEGNPPELEDESTYIQEEVEDGLSSGSRFVLLDRESLSEVIDEQQLRAALGARESRVGLGQMASAEALLIGKVHHDDRTIEIVVQGISADTGHYLNRADVAGIADTADQLSELCALLTKRVAQAFPRAESQVVEVRGEAAPSAGAMPLLLADAADLSAGQGATDTDAAEFLDALRLSLQGKGITLLDAASEAALAEERALAENTPETTAPRLRMAGELTRTEAGLSLSAQLRAQDAAEPAWAIEPDDASAPDAAALAALAADSVAQALASTTQTAPQGEGPMLTVGLGSADGVAPYSRCLVYRDLGPETDPRTGMVLGRRYTVVGDALLQSVAEGQSAAIMLSTLSATPEAGDVLVTK